MKKLLKVLLASMLVISMSITSVAFASGELNLCGSYADIAEAGSLLSYTDGSFAGEDAAYVADKVSSGFEYVQINGGVKNAVETPDTLTYEKGIGARKADDRSAKLNAYGKNAILAVAQLDDSDAETYNFFPIASDAVFVVEADFLKTDATQSQISFQTGNSYKYGTTVYMKADGSIEGRSYSTGSAVLTTFEGATWEVNKWHHIKLVYKRSEKLLYAFFDGKQVASYVLHDNTSKNGITNVKFTQEGGSASAPSSMYIDDAEIYAANTLEGAMNTDKSVVSELKSESENCLVDNANNTITYTSGTAPVPVSDLLGSLEGNAIGVSRDGKLITGGDLNSGDKVVVLSEDGRTFRYYSVILNYDLTNMMDGASVVKASPEAGNKVGDEPTVPANMFDGNESTYFQTFTTTEQAEFVVNLGSVKDFNQIAVKQPESITSGRFTLSMAVSYDDVTYVPVMNNAIVYQDKITTLNIPETKAKYVKISWNKYASDSNMTVALSEIELYKAERSENICRNVPVVEGSSMSYNAANSASFYAWLDDNAETAYLSGNLSNKTATYILDLGKRKNFSSLKLEMGSNTYYLGSCDLKISCSDDNAFYRDVAFFTGLVAKDVKDQAFDTAMSGRYIKLEFTNVVHASRTARLSLKDFALYYDGTVADPYNTGYTCYITKSEDGTKLNAHVDASAAIGEGFGGALIGAMYSDENTLIGAVILDDDFTVASDSEVCTDYPMDFAEGITIARVFFWRGTGDIAPVYGYNEYRE